MVIHGDAPESGELVTPQRSVAQRKVLVALLVYNGRSFVPRAVTSAARLQIGGDHSVDVVVFDDASPDPGFSEALDAQCRSLGVGYYCTPRNLGIPRNMNLGLLRAESAGYDYVVILNSDVIVPRNMIDSLVDSAESNGSIGSITAWSNNVSIFSLPNDDPDFHVGHIETVDHISELMRSEFASTVIDLPTGVGFCMMMSRSAIDEVGLFDPVFGRGYCEEVDWCQRAYESGLRNVLAPGVFVYHMGSASNREAGILAPGEKTVHTNEAIIDLRYPSYRDRLAEWTAKATIAPVVQRGLHRLVQHAALTHGYLVDASWLRRTPEPSLDQRVHISINPDGPAPLVEAVTAGWRCPIPIGNDGILQAIAAFVGCQPTEVRLMDRGTIAERLQQEATDAGVTVSTLRRYPERV
jgi:GT2 family glycosyltransferase